MLHYRLLIDRVIAYEQLCLKNTQKDQWSTMKHQSCLCSPAKWQAACVFQRRAIRWKSCRDKSFGLAPSWALLTQNNKLSHKEWKGKDQTSTCGKSGVKTRVKERKKCYLCMKGGCCPMLFSPLSCTWAWHCRAGCNLVHSRMLWNFQQNDRGRWFWSQTEALLDHHSVTAQNLDGCNEKREVKTSTNVLK